MMVLMMSAKGGVVRKLVVKGWHQGGRVSNHS